MNYAFSPIDDKTTRVGFVGGGFKQFYGQAYFGAHIGIMELASLLKSSYIFVGYYNSPYVSTATALNGDTTMIPNHQFRNNFYFEAAFNAFGDNVPKGLQSIRLKFGLMMPMAWHDGIAPSNKDFSYRLAVEVPIGGAIKY